MKIIKNICTLGFVTFLMFLLGSCESEIDLKPISTISSNSFWQSEEDVEAGINGMYNQFRSTFDIKSVIWGEYRTGFFGQGSSTATEWNDLWNNTMNSSNVGTNWSDFYILINDANLLIKKTPAIEFSNPQEKDHAMGQAYFVRAFAYFQMVKIWGDVPLMIEGIESTEQTLDPARSSKSDVFVQIKEDLDMAISLLGNRKSVNYMGIDAANMLKADVYLWTAKMEGGGASDLEIAGNAVDEVLGAGYGLEQDFVNVFRDENSNETIFSIFYSDLESGGGNRNGSSGRSPSGTHPCSIALPSLELTPPELQDEVPVLGSAQWLALSPYFLENILLPNTVDSRTEVTWQDVVSGSVHVTWINKYIGEEFSGTRIPTSDLIIYRFAEAILFKAEIENALNNTGEAISQLNRIAERAYGVQNYYSGLNQEQLDEAILDERILEFVMEGKSWYDIRRFGQAFTRIPSLVGKEGGNSGNILLFPVAQDVINRNINIEQTDGY